MSMSTKQSLPEVRERTVDELKRARRIFAAAHIMPDGDCVGSVLALGWALRELGKEVTLSLDDQVGDTFNYLPGWNELKPRAPADQDLFVYVDGSDRSRYGCAYDAARIGDRRVINIDHHVTNENFADVNLVDVKAASTAEIIFEVIRELNAPMTPAIAQALLTGIVTDTLGFRTAATTAETLQKSTELVRLGGDIPEIIDRVYNRRSFNSLRLLGYVIDNAHLEGPVIWSQVSKDKLKQLNVNGNGTGGIVNMLLSVADARIAFFLAEKDDGKIDLGLRSRAGTDVSGVAYRLGGGGHKQAAGATLPPPLESAAARVLAEIQKDLTKDE